MDLLDSRQFFRKTRPCSRDFSQFFRYRSYFFLKIYSASESFIFNFVYWNRFQSQGCSCFVRFLRKYFGVRFGCYWPRLNGNSKTPLSPLPPPGSSESEINETYTYIYWEPKKKNTNLIINERFLNGNDLFSLRFLTWYGSEGRRDRTTAAAVWNLIDSSAADSGDGRKRTNDETRILMNSCHVFRVTSTM